jgi:predicted N-acetyltransferase YhbS
MEILYAIEPALSEEEFTEVLKASSLGARRPLNEPERIHQMCRNANLIITARAGNRLVGIARCLSDFSYCTYLSDLAVAEDFQHMGIGKELIRRTRQAAPTASLILLSAPAAVDYYPKIGMRRHEAAFVLKPGEELC